MAGISTGGTEHGGPARGCATASRHLAVRFRTGSTRTGTCTGARGARWRRRVRLRGRTGGPRLITRCCRGSPGVGRGTSSKARGTRGPAVTEPRSPARNARTRASAARRDRSRAPAASAWAPWAESRARANRAISPRRSSQPVASATRTWARSICGLGSIAVTAAQTCAKPEAPSPPAAAAWAASGAARRQVAVGPRERGRVDARGGDDAVGVGGVQPGSPTPHTSPAANRMSGLSPPVPVGAAGAALWLPYAKSPCRRTCPLNQRGHDRRKGPFPSGEECGGAEDAEEGDEQGPRGNRRPGRERVPGGGQHDADRGEHRGPHEPQTGSGACERRGHGGDIIALCPPRPYGRSGRSESVRNRACCARSRGMYGPGAHFRAPVCAPDDLRLARFIHRTVHYPHPPNEGSPARFVLTKC